MLLQVKNLHFSYIPDQKLFTNLNISVEYGKIIALAGESGCGKSTLLNIIYGLLDWQQGEIIFEGKKLLGPKGNIVPGEQDMKMVAQKYDLMPYATVYDNVGQHLSNINLEDKRAKVIELLNVVGMQEYIDQKPHFLSGGQQQRVAIARALSVLPKLLLLDEPFSNLDFSRKIELREKLFRYVKEKKISVMISTHEIQEVMPWLDQIIVLQEGRLIQNDSPEESYRSPYNPYVAKLFGEVNIFSDEQMKLLNLKKNIWFPHEINISEHGKEAVLEESRFAGSHYWNKCLINNVAVIFYSKGQLHDRIRLSFS